MKIDLSPLASRLARDRNRALLIGLTASVLALLGAIVDRAQFLHSYLFAWLFWSGLSFGALVILMMQFLTGGAWGRAVRALSTAGFRTLPLMALLFVPVLLGLHHIYGWSNGARAEAPPYHHKAQYLNAPFFTGRALFFFIVLISLGVLLGKASRRPESRNLIALSAGGLILYVLCMNFASTDWVMSLDPQWYSTIFVEVFAVGQFLSALALMTSLLCLLTNDRALASEHEPAANISTKVFHDLGNLLLAFVIFWSYVSFAQFLIIWSGNLPKEISWYLDRSRGGWQWFALALMIFQFLLPFALLLSRQGKRNRQRLAWTCLCILLGNVASNFWFVAPTFHPRGFYLHWLDFADFIALGGIWFAAFFHIAKQRPLWDTVERERLFQHA